MILSKTQKPQQQGEKKRWQLQELGPGQLRISANCPGNVRKPAMGKAENQPHTPGTLKKGPEMGGCTGPCGSRTEGPKTQAKMSVAPTPHQGGGCSSPTPESPQADSGSAKQDLEREARSPAWESPGTTLRITRLNTEIPDSWDVLPAPNPALRTQTQPSRQRVRNALSEESDQLKRKDPKTVKTEAIPTTIHLGWWWWRRLSRQVVSNSCDPKDCSPPGSSVHGILQARRLEWGATSFSRGSSRPRDRTQVSWIGKADELPTELWGKPPVSPAKSTDLIYCIRQGFPGGAVDKNLPANAGDTGSIPGPGRFHKLWSN